MTDPERAADEALDARRLGLPLVAGKLWRAPEAMADGQVCGARNPEGVEVEHPQRRLGSIVFGPYWTVEHNIACVLPYRHEGYHMNRHFCVSWPQAPATAKESFWRRIADGKSQAVADARGLDRDDVRRRDEELT